MGGFTNLIGQCIATPNLTDFDFNANYLIDLVIVFKKMYGCHVKLYIIKFLSKIYVKFLEVYACLHYKTVSMVHVWLVIHMYLQSSLTYNVFTIILITKVYKH